MRDNEEEGIKHGKELVRADVCVSVCIGALGRAPVSHRTTRCPLSTVVINQPLIIELCREIYTHGHKHAGIESIHTHMNAQTHSRTRAHPVYMCTQTLSSVSASLSSSLQTHKP